MTKLKTSIARRATPGRDHDLAWTVGPVIGIGDAVVAVCALPTMTISFGRTGVPMLGDTMSVWGSAERSAEICSVTALCGSVTA